MYVHLDRYCLVNAFSNLYEIYSEYSIASTDDLIRFWTSNVKVTAHCRNGERIQLQCWDIEVKLPLPVIKLR